MKYLIIFLLPIISWANCGNNSTDFCNVKFDRVYDGDTFYVTVPKLHKLFRRNLGVRVNGIDTPELRGKTTFEKEMARTSRAVAQNFLSNAKKIDLLNCKKGKYFRIVCDVYADGESMEEKMLKDGGAKPY